ncbi:hypothetical protein M0657_007510 [Pyricularia oryzae]|uniref:Uncharacterized protein n=2 Tax=Pyricularia oryzae TaxID=318829 RepID=A0A4P7NPG1_PYROR|nr:hypothetical protein M0657_007510 [Pyricularia oryzae]KAI7926181.1 hypothetical protein M9X92_002926 [Pyricularia oryzae]QBZ64109.1 hypothetical protein PoMZ_05801 [Pyricularia oryzae]
MWVGPGYRPNGVDRFAPFCRCTIALPDNERANRLSAVPSLLVRDDDQGNQSGGSHST